MKYFKLFLLVAAVAFFGSCSDDKETQNSNKDVVVEMESPTFSAKEGAGAVKVPIKVTGKTNGNVYVTLAVKEVGNNPAKEDVHYYVTDKTITISDGTGYAEYRAVDDKEVNEDRTFEFEIVEAKGATIGAQNSCIVTIKDNDKDPYDRLQGKWKLTGYDNDGKTVSWNVTITEPQKKLADGSDNPSYDYEYGCYLYMSGLLEIPTSSARLNFYYDEGSGQGYVAFDCLGETNLASDLNFGDFTGYIKIVNDNAGSTSPLMGNWNSDFDTVTFQPDGGIAYAVYDKSTNKLKGYMGRTTGIVLTRK